MKKILLALAVAVGCTSLASAGKTYAHDASVLPIEAKSVIDNNFKAKVSVVKIEKKFGKVSEYEVTLTDGTEISFDSHGNWDDIEVNKASKIPSALIPSKIADYVAKYHKGNHIVGIDKSRSGYEIDLSNGVEMKFDKAGNFKRYDH